MLHPTAKEAFERGTNPIIIDNTNMQGWEMKPYVAQVSQLCRKTQIKKKTLVKNVKIICKPTEN